MIGGLVLGLGAALIGSRIVDDGNDTAAPVVDAGRDLPEVVDSPADLLPAGTPIPPGAGATSAEAAVAGFLDAEVDTDFETSFGFLDDAGRAEYGTPASWVAAHANRLPPITGFDLGERTVVDGSRATIASEVEFRAGLDQVIGLTPARATVIWNVVQGTDGGWGVSLETSAFTPRYPADSEVPGAVARWVDARQRCASPDNERDGLVGSAALADQLCGLDGDLTIGETETLNEVASQPIFTAFGDEAVNASRVVRLRGPVELAVVLVPIGDEWTVIAILA